MDDFCDDSRRLLTWLILRHFNGQLHLRTFFRIDGLRTTLLRIITFSQSLALKRVQNSLNEFFKIRQRSTVGASALISDIWQLLLQLVWCCFPVCLLALRRAEERRKGSSRRQSIEKSSVSFSPSKLPNSIRSAELGRADEVMMNQLRTGECKLAGNLGSG